MKLRPLDIRKDFEIIRNWVPDERAHAMWCANRFAYPLTLENFEKVLGEAAEKFGDRPFAAVSDDDKILGFFCYSLNAETNEGMLKFVVAAPEERGKGTAGEMLQMAIKYAFETTKADVVQLNVFPENPRAKRCYEKAGFKVRKTTEKAFPYKDELWGRCNMVFEKNNNN